MSEAGFKREVMMKALEIIDCHISCVVRAEAVGVQKMTKQYGTIEETRLCQSQLLIVSRYPRTPELFHDIMFPPSSGGRGSASNLFKNLNEFRAQVKKELGYPGYTYEDDTRTYFAKIGFSDPEARKPIPFTKL